MTVPDREDALDRPPATTTFKSAMFPTPHRSSLERRDGATAISTVTDSQRRRRRPPPATPTCPGNDIQHHRRADDDAGLRSILPRGDLTLVAAGRLDRRPTAASDNVTMSRASVERRQLIPTRQAIAVTVNDVDEFDVRSVTDSDAAANAVDENAANRHRRGCDG